MRLKAMICGVMVCGLLTAGAAGDELRHPSARKAVARAEQETRKAEQVYRQELARIQRALVSELERAKADAMQRQLLEDANAIQAAIDAARQELDRLEGKPVVEVFEIDAAKDWQATVEVRKGQRVEVRARGTWSFWVRGGDDGIAGPDGRVRDGSLNFYLEGRIGGGQPFKIGSNNAFVADRDGVIEMRMNESVSGPRAREDNAGVIRVQVTVDRHSAIAARKCLLLPE